MGPGQIILIIVLAVVVLGIAPLMALGLVLFTVLLVKNKPDKWPRACSAPDDRISRAMFDEGMAWAEKYADKKREVSVTSGKLRLAGEYFDFGSDRAVIILGGRTESMLYGYYFAEPYRRAGFNVLVADPRAHGLSQGKVNTVGFREYRDVLSWGRLLHDEIGVSHVFLHGICIGSQTGLFALTSKDCPDYFDGMVAEGMYTSFSETFANHMKHAGKPVFPMLYFVMFWLFLSSGGNAVGDGPLHRIGKLRKPILFLHSKEDIYSLPEKSSKIFERCETTHRVVWFEHGEHSRIRPVDTEKYDENIVDFLENVVYN